MISLKEIRDKALNWGVTPDIADKDSRWRGFVIRALNNTGTRITNPSEQREL